MMPTLEVLQFERGDYSLEREKACIKQAKSKGLEILEGDKHTLLFDLDSEAAYKLFMERVHFLEDKFGMIHLTVSKSKSGNWHAVAELDPGFSPVTPVLRLAIQACLGSDWKKEMLGCLRTIHYNSSDSKLFRPQPLEIVYEWRRENDIS